MPIRYPNDLKKSGNVSDEEGKKTAYNSKDPINWNADCESSFSELKQRLSVLTQVWVHEDYLQDDNEKPTNLGQSYMDLVASTNEESEALNMDGEVRWGMNRGEGESVMDGGTRQEMDREVEESVMDGEARGITRNKRVEGLAMGSGTGGIWDVATAMVVQGLGIVSRTWDTRKEEGLGQEEGNGREKKHVDGSSHNEGEKRHVDEPQGDDDKNESEHVDEAQGDDDENES